MRQQPETGPATILLRRWQAGETEASTELAALLYQELRGLAAHYLRDERPGHTLQPTALVHELYLRLFSDEPTAARDREHLFAMAAQQMRHILIDYARKHSAEKRGGGHTALPLEVAADLAVEQNIELLELDAALQELEAHDPRSARAVELRYFAGLTEQETAKALGISLATLKRDWQFARAWLHSRLSSPGER